VDHSVPHLYGTTSIGGPHGYGTAFEFSASAVQTLWGFGETNGSQPYGGLTINKKGYLCGTTSLGGKYDGGTVFELIP
jgi:uncharacterized repeat protein (TIGR03803 family)